MFLPVVGPAQRVEIIRARGSAERPINAVIQVAKPGRHPAP
jgi:hypothetical protein